ncbi:NifB/NifX family molybdenum-iron cluster-binding protein [Acetobacterium bakii]|uniref:Dinitrogenase iron-molybdenum cofactor biosynthesis domain-containing protein n=1 Tax=Acetobacterium bakii TaxID=52689 RepID=A0A0L6U199_9FIRM|nr:NifB/NifX family molybdenum-iron cluster-binding protein [Acetobacterium bakii]KNZ42278.1 hypothetical protein AKG39_07105 [Acetobacterium bakii]
MYLAMTTDGKTLESNVSQRFEECKYLLVVDTNDLSVNAIENTAALTQEGMAQKVIEFNCEGIITGVISHPGAFDILADAYITRFLGSGHSGTEALALMDQRELALIRNISGSDHCDGDHDHHH